MNRPDKAEELFRKGYNCSQSVFAAFADVLGMSVEEAAKIASPFGAGFGKLREVCGAVSGMTLAAGYLKGYDDPADYESKKELYKLILEGMFVHGGNPVLRWMAGNVVAEIDAAENIKPSKKKSTEKIDGIVAWIMALDRMIRHEMQGSVYDEPDHDLIVL